MDQQKAHDLYDFMRQISSEMASEYERIRKRTTEDPGTAGDQGEENWAELLRDWLPRTCEVVTKGRIISQDGTTSPQIDVLVLKEVYPKKLLNKKLYLAAGVAAAFECKTTLKSSHVFDALNNCASIKGLYPRRYGTPYKELHAPLIYGLLAHSHAWKGEKSAPAQNIELALCEADATHASHPRFQLDLLCVADLAAWTSSMTTFIGPHQGLDWSTLGAVYGPSGSAASGYIGHTRELHQQIAEFTPIGVLISNLSQRLAWEEPRLQDLADYYRIVNIAGFGMGTLRTWPSSIYSEEVRHRVESGRFSTGQPWDEWQVGFY